MIKLGDLDRKFEVQPLMKEYLQNLDLDVYMWI